LNDQLARHNISTIEKALLDKRSAAISEIIQIVPKLSSQASSISINDLSELIGRDPSTMEKIISASNTISFKVGGPRIAGQTVHSKLRATLERVSHGVCEHPAYR
jgi:HD-like signal output (HDOD) protein